MKRIVSLPTKLLAVGLLGGLGFFLFSSSLMADTVFKKDGGKLRGKILEDNKEFVRIKAYGSVYKIPKEEILRIERDGDIRREFKARKKKLKDWDEKSWLKLGEWCQENELHPEAIDCFYKVISINTNNADARWELGHRRLRGKWVPSREYYEAKGYVRHNGVWMTKADQAKYKQGLLKDGDEWISKDEYQRRMAKRSKKGIMGELGGSSPEPEPEPAPKKKQRRRARNPFGGFRPGFGAPRQDQPETPDERKARVAQKKAAGSWATSHMSTYYNFFSNGPISETKQYAAAMDKACVTFKKIFNYKKDIVRSFPIFMYANQPEFGQKTGRGQGVGGYYTSDGKIVSFHSRRAQSTLFHEGTHQFQGLALGRNMWSAKIWFIEGLATYFEGSKVRKKDIDTSPIPRDRLGSVKRAINSGSYIKLKTLIRMEQREFGAVHYAHAWSLIYFFVNGTKGGRKRFQKYFEGVKEGREGIKLFEECFDKPIEEIEKFWLDYVKRMK
jgi:hypothetical protein